MTCLSILSGTEEVHEDGPYADWEGVGIPLLVAGILQVLCPLLGRAQAPPVDTTAVDTVRHAQKVKQLGPAQTFSDDSVAAVNAVEVNDRTRRTPTPAVDTGLVRRYLPARTSRSPGLFEQPSPFLGPRAGRTEEPSIRLDSTRYSYHVETERLGGPMRLTKAVYRRERYRANLRDNWRTLLEQRQQQQRTRGGLGVNMTVPGGRESAFSTVFGKPQVDLRLNGQADINAGFKYRKSDQQVSITGNASQLNPSFKQDLRLGVTGTIGDKLKINVD
ncbi:MAG: hypothetical protein ABEK84_03230, partial [Salinibacter sp.]